MLHTVVNALSIYRHESIGDPIDKILKVFMGGNFLKFQTSPMDFCMT